MKVPSETCWPPIVGRVFCGHHLTRCSHRGRVWSKHLHIKLNCADCSRFLPVHRCCKGQCLHMRESPSQVHRQRRKLHAIYRKSWLSPVLNTGQQEDPCSVMPLQKTEIHFYVSGTKPLTRVSKRVPGVHGKRGLERGWQKRLAKGWRKGWRRVGKGLAKAWQRVGGFPCTLQFRNSRGARLESWVCDSMVCGTWRLKTML